MSDKARARRAKKSEPVSPPLELKQAVWDEALAAITVGFAHDANNCLTGIFSMSDLCLAQVEPQNPLHESLSLMRDSASQASQILQRLARLIHDVPGTRTYHDLNELASETADIMRRMLSRNVAVRLELHAEPLPIFADAVELRQVLICLALNVADAIHETAAVVISTRACAEPLKWPNLCSHDLSPPFVSVQVGDSATESSQAPSPSSFVGQGRGEKSIQRLLIAKAFAENHGGALALEPRPTGGNVVHLCLPRADLS
jgi:signal transduction histidine kinase